MEINNHCNDYAPCGTLIWNKISYLILSYLYKRGKWTGEFRLFIQTGRRDSDF